MTRCRRELPFESITVCLLDFPTTCRVPASKSRVRGTLNAVENGCAFRERSELGCSADTVRASGFGTSLMIVRTVEQVRRAFRIVAGFTLLLAGLVMVITPGPGWLVIFLGLSLLAAEFIWARRLMDRMKREGERVRDAVWSIGKSAPATSSPEDASPAQKTE
jgi:Putative transmembrane protein (PGPGW)